MYRIVTSSRRVEKEITDLPSDVRGRVVTAIKNLAGEPRPDGVRKLSGELKGAWRVRIGDYRVLYDIDDERQLITLLAVLHRREAYR
ncbi:MAG: type II toxin-antitoxin system RelE/ParE family toxin [Thermoflexales bacterium]|nr:type II toxin-antitoxin system RelE/ParE family toxin [Thermoflexales bacterium]